MLVVATPAWAQIGDKKPDPYEKITTQAQADQIKAQVLKDLAKSFGLSLSRPVELHLVDAKVMDEQIGNSPYKGAEIGLYTGIKNGKHQVYVMEGWSRDKCQGITAHELVHAWQTENGLQMQEQALVEGLAMWIEYKYFDQLGAYQMSENIRDTADPVYGVGIKTLLGVEDRVGTANVVREVRKVRTVAELEAPKAGR